MAYFALGVFLLILALGAAYGGKGQISLTG